MAALTLLTEGSSTFLSVFLPSQNVRDSPDALLVLLPQLFKGDVYTSGDWKHDCAEVTSKQKPPSL